MAESLSSLIRQGNSTPIEDALADAAPELYEACKELLDKAYRVNDRYVAGGSPAGSLGLAIEEMAGMLCKARAALAKAQARTGGERGEG